jgi:hypothetical protein
MSNIDITLTYSDLDDYKLTYDTEKKIDVTIDDPPEKKLSAGEVYAVSSYTLMSDKPSINGNELEGNKTGTQLGLLDEDDIDSVPLSVITDICK